MSTAGSASNNGSDPHSTFSVTATDERSAARVGLLRTRRGDVRTPAFMPVGTQATVKALSPDEVAETGAEIVLANTYHLMLRPGPAIIEHAGGVQRFMNWPGPVLTDSGGFQVFSLAANRRVDEAGVVFRSHLDGSAHELRPERAIDLQLAFGSDIIMPLDDLVGFESDDRAQAAAMARTHRWLNRARDYFQARVGDDANRPLLFGIAQGGFNQDRRRESARFVATASVDGCAVGGLSVGESKDVMEEMLAASVSNLPHNKPRYLMGVGSPEDLWRGVAAGIDMFDCVHPTRVARRGALFTPDGRVNVTASRFREHFGPVDSSCDCMTCREYSAAYLNHLFRCRELLAYRLASIHNLRFVQRQMIAIRSAIAAGRFPEASRAFLERYRVADHELATAQKRAWRDSVAGAGQEKRSR